MLLRRISALIIPLLILLLIELSFWNIYKLFFLLAVGLLILLIDLKVLIKERFFSKNFLSLALLPVLAYVFTVGFLLLPIQEILRHLISGLFAFLLILYLSDIFFFYWHSAAYRPQSLENLSAVFNLIIFFLLAINLNTLNIFLNLPLWQLSLILMATIVLLLWQSFWSNRLLSKLKYVYLVVINVVIVEFFWALTFLPNNYYVNSIILTIIFYFIWGIFKFKLKDQFDKKLVWHYLIISSILLLLIIFTSSWT